MTHLPRPWGRMHATRTGSGLPTLVFVNSLGTDLRMWDGVTDRLPHRTALRFDLRGHGESDLPAGPWTVEDLAQDVLALMDHHGTDRAVIVGCSVGGMVAQAAALAAPDRVAGLVLSNTAARIGTPDTWSARIAAVRAGGLPAIADAVIDRWFAPAFRDEPAARLWRDRLLSVPPAGYAGTCDALSRADLRARVPAIACPALFIAGGHDLATPPALVAETAALIPGARLATLAGSGHLPAIDAPAAVADLIDRFITESIA